MLTATDIAPEFITAAIAECVKYRSGVDFNAAATASVAKFAERHGIDCPERAAREHNAALRLTQGENAARIAPRVAKELGCTVDELRATVRYIFSEITKGRDLTPNGRTIAMGHACSGTWLIGTAAMTLEWQAACEAARR